MIVISHLKDIRIKNIPMNYGYDLIFSFLVFEKKSFYLYFKLIHRWMIWLTAYIWRDI